MEREQYVAWRNVNSPEPLYEYYKEHYKGDKMLDIQIFMKGMSIWPHARETFFKLTRMYDIKFEVVILQDLRTGALLKYL